METAAERTSAGFVLLPNEGRSFAVAGEEITFKAVSADTGGAWTMMEFKVPPHFAGPPPHRHEKELEAFYVLSGTLTIQLEERSVKSPPGSFALIPPGTVHTFSNEEDDTTTFLSLMSPGGFEGFVEELDEMMGSEKVWPPADMSRYRALNAKYGMYAAGASATNKTR